jgi:putative Holliday junction resolvase
VPEISVLGLDLGRKRIGMAGCDRTGLVATELGTIHRSSWEQDVDQLRAIARDRQATVLLIGLPLTLSGTDSKQTRITRKLGRRIGTALDLPVIWVDERLTSVAAAESLRSQGIADSEQRGRLDARAAVLIVQQWLDEGGMADWAAAAPGIPGTQAGLHRDNRP